MKSTWFGCSHRYEFAKCLQAADYTRHSFDLFREWLEVCHGSFVQAINKFRGTFDDELEGRIVKIREGHRDRKKFPEAMAHLVAALEKKRHDVLGTLFMELGANDGKWKGQFFTPEAIATLMAQLTLPPKRGKEHEGRTLWLNEPACGGGAMVLATSQILFDRGFFPWDFHWFCNDVDWKCFAMTHIQLTLCGIPAFVAQSNTITLEEWTKARTIISHMHPPRNAPESREQPADWCQWKVADFVDWK